ncbi:PIR Superfamily Protein [Plasmodium ovale curtisi]|uniref:PIR Superfamily Protein n=1 Tax=Plasmodium ovale curtisi TaxID=864141 RepID=A0A1A8XCR5_PLAOA|nr:PIR Superfamily Protein [Plasmodium ovale curtisi]
MTDKSYYEDDDLRFLPSIRNYKHLDTYGYDDLGNSVICGVIKRELINYLGIEKLCKEITGILEEFNTSNIISLFNNDYCTIFNYWMYYHLYNNLTPKNNSQDVSSFIDKLLKYREKYKDDKCTIDTELNSRDYFTKTKMLYDYALDYKSIKSNVETPGAQCTKKYNDYIDKHSRNYNTVITECKSEANTPYCKLLKKIQSTLSPLKACRQKSSILSPVSKEETVQTFPRVSSERGHEDEIEERREPGDPGLLYLQPEAHTYGTSNSSTIMSIIFPFLGIFFTFFILYRFTPIGSLLNNYFLKKKIFRTYVNEEGSEQILEDTYESMNRNMEYGTHHIGYHSY